MKISFLTILMFWSTFVFSQPSEVDINNCSQEAYNGTYLITEYKKFGAPCYISTSDSLLTLELSSSGWIFGKYLLPWRPCDDIPFSSNLFSNESPKDVTMAVPNGNMCGNEVIVSGSNKEDIPTLSFWTTCILLILLLIISITSSKLVKSEYSSEVKT